MLLAAVLGLTVLISNEQVVVDGSSTVFPISEAVGEDFQKTHKDIRVAIAVSGTGGGFKKFCNGEVDITGASRPIEKTEIALCAAAKGKPINYIELPIAHDGITVVVNKDNTWAKELTVEELKAIWSPDSKINNWKQVRKEFPDLALKLYGPGHDSGTFDYFTKAIVGTEKSSRSDFSASEDDNMIVRGVSNDKGALGYFGFAYFESNAKRLNAVAIKWGTRPALTPSPKTILSGDYKPLSRPLFIYVNTEALKRKAVSDFTNFYLQQAAILSAQVGYVALSKDKYDSGLQALKKGSGR